MFKQVIIVQVEGFDEYFGDVVRAFGIEYLRYLRDRRLFRGQLGVLVFERVVLHGLVQPVGVSSFEFVVGRGVPFDEEVVL